MTTTTPGRLAGPAPRRHPSPAGGALVLAAVLVTAVSGCVLIVMGLLILTGELTQLNVQAQKGLSNLGLDFLYKI